MFYKSKVYKNKGLKSGVFSQFSGNLEQGKVIVIFVS